MITHLYPYLLIMSDIFIMSYSGRKINKKFSINIGHLSSSLSQLNTMRIIYRIFYMEKFLGFIKDRT